MKRLLKLTDQDIERMKADKQKKSCLQKMFGCFKKSDIWDDEKIEIECLKLMKKREDNEEIWIEMINELQYNLIDIS